jgi:hypothetical protein
MEWELAGVTEVLEETPFQCHFVHYKSHMMTSDQTQVTVVGSPQLLAWTMV